MLVSCIKPASVLALTLRRTPGRCCTAQHSHKVTSTRCLIPGVMFRRCVGSPEPGELSSEHAKLLTNFAKAVVRRLQALKFVQLDAVSPFYLT